MFSFVVDLVGGHPKDRQVFINEEDIEDTWKPCVENARTNNADICRHMIFNFLAILFLCLAKSNYFRCNGFIWNIRPIWLLKVNDCCFGSVDDG